MRCIRRAVFCLILCCAGPVLADDLGFDVQWNGCTEYVGIGYIPFAKARELVPSDFTLATGPTGKAILVVRATSCSAASIAGGNPQAVRTAQVGISLSGQDPGADINNYLLWFVTDSAALTSKMQAAGIHPGAVQLLTLAYTQLTSTLALNVTAIGSASYTALGSASAPTSSPVPFIANWFFEGEQGVVRMHTAFPAIRFGTAHTVLTPTPATEMAALVGSLTLEWDVLDSYNSWSSASMQSRMQ